MTLVMAGLSRHIPRRM